jgi:hypothetical protein
MAPKRQRKDAPKSTAAPHTALGSDEIIQAQHVQLYNGGQGILLGFRIPKVSPLGRNAPSRSGLLICLVAELGACLSEANLQITVIHSVLCYIDEPQSYQQSEQFFGFPVDISLERLVQAWTVVDRTTSSQPVLATPTRYSGCNCAEQSFLQCSLAVDKVGNHQS